MFGLLELNKGLSSFVLHILGLLFVAARVAHAAQLSAPDSVPKKCREFGFLATAGLLSLLGVLNLIGYLTTPRH